MCDVDIICIIIDQVAAAVTNQANGSCGCCETITNDAVAAGWIHNAACCGIVGVIGNDGVVDKGYVFIVVVVVDGVGIVITGIVAVVALNIGGVVTSTTGCCSTTSCTNRTTCVTYRFLCLLPWPVLVIRMLFNMYYTQPFGLLDIGLPLGMRQQFPFPTQSFAYLCIVHVRRFGANLFALYLTPDHERVHWAFDMIGRAFSR